MWKLSGKKNKYARAEKQTLATFSPAYEIYEPENITSSIIIASPHSGRLYPSVFLKQTSLGLHLLRLPEDHFVDQIFRPLTAHGISFLAALFPRSFVDVNRDASEWPLAPPYTTPLKSGLKINSRVKAGLGVIPTHIARDVPIYAHALSIPLIQARLDALYHPYHAALNGLLQNTKAHMGKALLLDCHSMPGEMTCGQKRADIILGDRFGRSCTPETIDILDEKLQALGYTVTRNIPYAGGYVTHHYGQPNMGVETIQIEINKDLYLDPQTLEPTSNMAALSTDMREAVLYLHETLHMTRPLAAQ